MRFITIPFLLIVLSILVKAQDIRMAEIMNEPPDEETMNWFLDAKFGMFICYNMATYEEVEWVEGYPDPSIFNPGARVNTDAWADAAVSAGMKYGVLTVKHVSGFCLWDSKYTTYDVMNRNCPYKEDLVAQYIKSFKSRGLKVGLYYCWRNPGFDDEYDGRYKVLPPECDPATHSLEDQIEFQKQQIVELLEKYPDVFYIFNDALDPRIMPANEAAAFFRSADPTVLASANWWDWNKKGTPYLDLAVTEIMHFPNDNNYPGETNWCLENDWFWNRGYQTKEVRDIIPHIDTANARHANFLLNVGLDKEGNIIESSVRALAEIGDLRKDSDQANEVAPLSLEKQGEAVVLMWRPQSDNTVRIGPPTFVVGEDPGSNSLPVEIFLNSQKCFNDRAECEYLLMIEDDGTKHAGTYRIKWFLEEENNRVILRQSSDLQFANALPLDVTVSNGIEFPGGQASQCTFPQRNGMIKCFDVDATIDTTAFFVIGRGAITRNGSELAMPLIGLGDNNCPGGNLAFATDPYCGIQFRIAGGKGYSTVSTTTTYKGSLVPIDSESRVSVLSYHRSGIDGMLSTFYETITDIEPAAAWTHEIQLNYFDYLSDQGKGWFEGLEKLAEKIPLEKRKSVVVTMHGWYDYLGRYTYDQKTGKLDDSWIAFPKTRKIPMSKAEMHKRVRFAKELGFRCLLYYADGLNSQFDMSDYPDSWIYYDENGHERPGWTGPSTGRTTSFDPGNPQVRQFYLDYTNALLEEYGSEIDGLVWDETHYISQERLASRSGRLAYADREFMTLVAEITGIVQEWRKVNPDLVFLTSDNVGVWGEGHIPYALVAHGNYQDSHMRPDGWPPGLLQNYRNCLWSCNWWPVKNHEHNLIAPEVYGLPQGLSNGFGDDRGPAEMPEKMLDEVIQRLLERDLEVDRIRYLTKPTEHVIPAHLPTTRQDASGGCDGIKTGTYGFYTKQETDPWWLVDLGKAETVDRLVIYNRCDSNMELRARHLKVIISEHGTEWTEVYQHDGTPFLGYSDGKPLSVALNGVRARWVRIQLPGKEYLHLDEVEVYTGNKNIALGKPADQSSVSELSSPDPAKTKISQ